MTDHLGRRPVLAPAVTALVAVLCFSAPAAAAPPEPPHVLPGDAVASSVKADRSRWIVGARPGPESRAIARRMGARSIGGSAWVVPARRAGRLAAALERAGVLTYSEPDRLSQRRQAVAADPLSPQARWRDVVADPGLAPPPVTPTSPLLALIDSRLDETHPEFGAGNVATLGTQPLTDTHGTATAAVAAAPVNGVGIVGVWPGMRALNLPVPTQIRCSDSSSNINRAVSAGAAVINMSYGSASPCFAEYEQLQRATRAGVTLVAAAGNELAAGNPLEFPASLPHVLTVAAVGADLRATYFSNANAAVDLSAPGEGILTAVPPAYDRDGRRDGYEAVDGTSFSAPMVSAAAAWVRAQRPELTPDQVAQVVRLGARDVGRRGWEPSTGFGVLSVEGALRRKAPPEDPAEPNDGIVWVDGRAFGAPARPLWRGRGVARRFGLLDRFEDPIDVFRVVVPARSSARAVLSPRGGDPDLFVLPGTARAIPTGARFQRALVASSRRAGRRTDIVTWRNRSRKARTFYLFARVHAGSSSFDAAYDLTIRRAR
ncbi:MAG: hypothetical protein AVDCRST_MAG65-1353 [uncultured Solirubrobacteraceae bacterium]|uniref:Peptidase S8/S53 domain-containing protein n=1 Tax=uncultured Solirubrobacteraceae bacterium TaxID=1162706 RepID=A0A6J4RQ77_9ACTN|nr:MAG: hypothetical protein AVDCRST_MAG65-1353 [uncultured Solirubrobacteraceae bacterium]